MQPPVDLFLARLKKIFDHITLPHFEKGSGRVRIARPRLIANPHCMFIGEGVQIGPNSVLAACTEFRSSLATISYTPRIHIGSHVWATSSLQLYAAKEVIIEDYVLIASNVFISDYSHGIANIEDPFMYQPYEKISPVRIGRGSWIGQNVIILPGVSIGRQCVIGANSVVRHSLPDCVLAAGAPAQIIKRFDSSTATWVRLAATQGA
jgi:acetyltransferase-like isoleucine patch superfamily enzyme